MNSDETAGLLRRIKALERENAELRSLLDRVEDPAENVLSPEALVQILDGIEADIYVADVDSYEVLFMNRHMIESFGGDYTGSKCYRAFTIYEEPCPHCTISELIGQNGEPKGPVRWEGRNSITGHYNVNVDRAMYWSDGRLVKVQVATDVTDRKKALSEIQFSQKKYQEIFDKLPIGVSVSDEQGNIIEANKSAEEIVGLDSDNHTAGSIESKEWQIVSPDGSALATEELPGYRALKEGRVVGGERMGVKRPDGSIAWIKVTAAPIDLPGYGVVVAYMDISESIETEAALRKSESMLMESQAMARVGGWEYDKATDVSTWTDEVYRILECEPDVVPNMELVLSFFSDGDREKLVHLVKRAKEEHEPYDITLKARTAKDTARWVRIKGRPIIEQGKTVRLSGTIQDTTEQHEAEEERRHWLGLFEKLVQASPNCIIQLDLDGRLNYVSPRGLNLFGLNDKTTYAGTRFVEWVAPEDRKFAEKNIESMINGSARQTEENEYLMLKGNGETFYGAFNSSVIRDQEGNAAGMIIIVRDVSEKRRMNLNLIEAKEQAEAASRAKGEFLANMSHEIRTPLNGVLGMLQLAMLTNLDQEQREYVETALNSGRSLLRIINDVLDFSKIEAGKVEIGKEDFCLQDMVDSVIEVFRNQAGRKRIELSREIDKDAPEIVIGDEGRLRQILFNLVGNAIKFTESGQILVKVGAKEEEGQKARLHFEVEDTGIGIPEDKVGHIFDSFTQVDGSYTRKHAGTGLGLSIVKRLVELMDGKIEIESKLGKGTRVRFDVLLGMERRAEERRPATEDSEIMPEMNRSRLLLVEDDDINRITTRLFLEKLGYEVGIAVNGREALERCEEETYDLVLMDIQMPEMDGLEAARRIRDGLDGETPRDVPIVAITAHAMKGDRERFLNSGMDEYVAKPLDMRELARVLERLTSEVTQKA